MQKWKNWLIVPPIIVGVVIFAVIVKLKSGPQQISARELVRTVRIIPATSIDVVPRAIGYGYVQPGQSWEAVAEVSGRVIEIHKELKKGFFIKQGELLLKIDPATYGLAEERGKAAVRSVDAQLKELEQNKKNNQRLLETEQKSLKLSARDLERKRKLFEKELVSKEDLEHAEKAYLAQQSSVNALKNRLDLIPAQRKALLAQKSSGISTLTDYQINLAKTEIRAPFDCRIAQVNVEQYQFANAGSILLVVEGVDSVEIPVKIPPKTFSNLIPQMENVFEMSNIDMDTIRRAIGISAIVRLPFFREDVYWLGRFSRTSEAIDLSTGALTVYVAVDEPYAHVNPGKKPPLIKNMYCEVELNGRPRPRQIIIPYEALHQETVFVVGPENRLEIRKAKAGFAFGGIVIIEKGLVENENIVVTDLSPAIEGMLLKPVTDEKRLKEIKLVAAGQGEI